MTILTKLQSNECMHPPIQEPLPNRLLSVTDNSESDNVRVTAILVPNRVKLIAVHAGMAQVCKGGQRK
jgi:hypothetical protein